MKIKSEIEISAVDLRLAVQAFLKGKLGPGLIINVDSLKDSQGDLTSAITVSATLEKHVSSYAEDR